MLNIWYTLRRRNTNKTINIHRGRFILTLPAYRFLLLLRRTRKILRIFFRQCFFLHLCPKRDTHMWWSSWHHVVLPIIRESLRSEEIFWLALTQLSWIRALTRNDLNVYRLVVRWLVGLYVNPPKPPGCTEPMPWQRGACGEESS